MKNTIKFLIKTVIISTLLLLSTTTRAEQWNNKDWPYTNPSNASTKQDNYLLVKTFFTLSYNNTTCTPNWVAWSLTANDIGKAPRVEFYPDKDIPRSFQHVTPNDYSTSGFDRGHLCNHQDRSATLEASQSTFTMANMMPQSPDLNRKAWESFEKYCRTAVKRGYTAHIICGPAGQGGEGSKGNATTIGKTHKIAVPTSCWKLAVFEKDGKSKTIAIIMPNKMGIEEEWKPYMVELSDVEKLTGFTFFKKQK